MDSNFAHMMAASKVSILKPDNAQRRLEVKARSTLIIGIPNEHQLKFNSIKDAKQLMEAIEKRFGGNAATKKTHRNLLKQQYENFTALNSEMLDQTTNGAVNTAHRVSTASTQVNAANSSNIHPDDLEEINLKWQIAVLTMRAERFLKKTGRKLTVNGNKTIGFDKTNIECYNCHKRGHFPRECKALKSQDTKHKESTRRTMPVKSPASTALVSCDSLGGYDWSDQAEEGPNYALMAFTSTSSDLKLTLIQRLSHRLSKLRAPECLPLLLDEPYVAVRQAHLVDTDTEFGPEEAPSEIEECQPLVPRAPLTDEEFEASEPSDTRITTSHSLASSNSTAPLLHDHLLTQASPTLTRICVPSYRSSYETSSSSSPPAIPIQKRYQGTSELVEDTEDESLNSSIEREGFPAHSCRSSNAIALDSPYLLVLITKTSQSRQHALWHGIYDIQRENHDLRRQIVEERCKRLELTDHVARMERRHESRGE
nr:hypothetical protein [Tanacetum cinerariifolium]